MAAREGNVSGLSQKRLLLSGEGFEEDIGSWAACEAVRFEVRIGGVGRDRFYCYKSFCFIFHFLNSLCVLCLSLTTTKTTTTKKKKKKKKEEEEEEDDNNNNNNNNLRLLQLQSNRAIIQYQHPPRRAALYTEGLSRLNCCHTWRTAIESTAPA